MYKYYNYKKFNNNILNNLYLKININIILKYPKLKCLQLNIILKKNINNYYIIFCIFYLFKYLLNKKGFFIYLNNKRKKKYNILQYNLKKNIMYYFLLKYIKNILVFSKDNQNLNININSFNKKNNFYLFLNNLFNINNVSLKNKNYLKILNYFNIFLIFNFKKNNKFYNKELLNCYCINF